MQKRNKILLLWIFILSMVSCSLEQRVAIKYQKEIPKTYILLSTEPELYKINNKAFIPENISDERYNMLYQKSMDSSDFVSKIDIYAYWNNCKKEIEKNILSSGLKYLPSDSITEFIDKNKPKFIFDIKQVEIEEYSIDFVDTFYSSIDAYGYFSDGYSESINAVDFTAVIDNYDIEYLKYFQQAEEENTPGEYTRSESIRRQSLIEIIKPINAVAINYWIEVNSYLKNEGHKRELIYLSVGMEDAVSNDMDLNYDNLLNIKTWYKFSYLGYQIDSINVNNIWQMSGKWAKEVTDILNSYIVDRVIEDNIHKASDTKYRKRHWILNTKTGRILPTDRVNYTVVEQYEND